MLRRSAPAFRRRSRSLTLARLRPPPATNARGPGRGRFLRGRFSASVNFPPSVSAPAQRRGKSQWRHRFNLLAQTLAEVSSVPQRSLVGRPVRLRQTGNGALRCGTSENDGSPAKGNDGEPS